MMLIAQLSDLHFSADTLLGGGQVNTAALLQQCLDHLLRSPVLPSLVLITGDLTDEGRVEDYQALRQRVAALPMPVYVMPGNHDDRARLVEVFAPHGHRYLLADEPGSPFIQYEIEHDSLSIICLDSVVTHNAAGDLCPDRLAWLEARLARSNKPTIVALHHPPFLTGIDAMDAISLQSANALEQVIARYPQVIRVVCGHLHRSVFAPFAHTMASSCPSPAHQIHLDLRPAAPGAYTLEPPGYHLHHWNGEKLTTHVVNCHPAPGPFIYP